MRRSVGEFNVCLNCTRQLRSVAGIDAADFTFSVPEKRLKLEIFNRDVCVWRLARLMCVRNECVFDKYCLADIVLNRSLAWGMAAKNECVFGFAMTREGKDCAGRAIESAVWK